MPQGSTALGLELRRQPPARALLCPSAALAQSTRIRTPGPQPRALPRDGREGAHVPEGREKELGAGGLSCPDPGQRAVGSALNTHSAPKVPSPLTCRPWAARRADTARWARQALIAQQPPNLRNKKQQRGGPRVCEELEDSRSSPNPPGDQTPGGGRGQGGGGTSHHCCRSPPPAPSPGTPQLYPEPPHRRPGSLFQPVLRGRGQGRGWA